MTSTSDNPAANGGALSNGLADLTTPAMRQYAEQKAQVPDAVLLFRMGDFYETFFDDARTIAKALGIALTSRGKSGDSPIPLAGIPHHALDGYLSRLVRAGYKVAISEQMEDPKLAKGVVKRQIVRIVTPGTLTESNLLNEHEDNFLAACVLGGAESGVAWVEISTGEFHTLVVPTGQLIDELVRIRPAEILLPEIDMRDTASSTPSNTNSMTYRRLQTLAQQHLHCAVTIRSLWWFEQTQAIEALCRQFAVKTLEGFGYVDADNDDALGAAGALLRYLDETQKTTLSHLRPPHPVSRHKYLQLDPTTVRSLELERTIRTGSRDKAVLGILDQTCTAMGSRLLRQWLLYPLKDLDAIVARQDAVDLFLQRADVVRQLRTALKEYADLERIVSRVVTGRASPRDVLGLGRTLTQLPTLRQTLEPICVAESHIEKLVTHLCGLDELASHITAAISESPANVVRDGGVIADGFDAELDRLRSLTRDGQAWLAEFQARQIERTGIPSLKVGYNSVFGYYIELSHAQAEKAPADFVRRQTLKNAERYITDELKKYEDEQLTAQQRSIDLEIQLFDRLRAAIVERAADIQRAAHAIAQADVLGAFAYIASMRGYCRPEMVTTPVLKISQGRHPVLDVTLAEKFVANDVDLLPEKTTTMIITGPNMAGKSTYIRQVALLTLLAHTGSYIPASQATIGLCDRIFTRIGASDELTAGQSTFMVEMTEAANIVNNATVNSLIILDEIGRGTSTYDGLSLAWAIAEHLTQATHARTLFATHYHELTELESLVPAVKNFNVLVREWHDQIIFLHKIALGGTDKSYGIHVGRLAGLPKSVIARAGVILGELERGFSREVRSGEITDRIAQPELFDAVDSAIIDELKQLELNAVTPLQAMQILHDLQVRVKSS